MYLMEKMIQNSKSGGSRSFARSTVDLSPGNGVCLKQRGLCLQENRNDSFLQLGIVDNKIWTQYEQLSILFIIQWSHYGLNYD